MNLRFLGTTCSPQGDNDCPSVLINCRFLVNTGFDALTTLKKLNLDILKIDHIILTSSNPERYIGLAGLLKYMDGFIDISTLTILGPLETPVIMAKLFGFARLEMKKMPSIVILEKDACFDLPDATIVTGKEFSLLSDIPLLFNDKADNKKLIIDLGQNDYALEFIGADALIKNCKAGITSGKELSKKAKVPVLFPVNTDEKETSASLSLTVKSPKRETEYILY